MIPKQASARVRVKAEISSKNPPERIRTIEPMLASGGAAWPRQAVTSEQLAWPRGEGLQTRPAASGATCDPRPARQRRGDS